MYSRHMRAPVLSLCLALIAASAAGQDYLQSRPKAKEGFAYPTLYCVNRGVRVEVGELSCIRTNCCPTKGCDVFTARCGLSTNVTTWRRVREGCDPALSLGDPAPRAMSLPAPG